MCLADMLLLLVLVLVLVLPCKRRTAGLADMMHALGMLDALSRSSCACMPCTCRCCKLETISCADALGPCTLGPLTACILLTA
jgi:hypothetical protein